MDFGLCCIFKAQEFLPNCPSGRDIRTQLWLEVVEEGSSITSVSSGHISNSWGSKEQTQTCSQADPTKHHQMCFLR